MSKKFDSAQLNSNVIAKTKCLSNTILAYLSEVQMGSIYEKIEVENLVTLPL